MKFQSQTKDTSLYSLRETLILNIYRYLLIPGWFAFLSVLWVEYQNKQYDRIFLIYLPAIVIFSLITIIKSTPYLVRTLVLVLLMLMIGFSELYYFGLASMGFMFLVLAILITYSFHGYRIGLIVLLLAIISSFLFGLAYEYQWIPVSEIQQNVSRRFSNWIAPTMSFSFVAGCSSIIVAYLLEKLNRALQDSDNQALLLQQKHDSLKIANQKLNKAAHTDSLTGMANYRSFKSDVNEAINTCISTKTKLVLCVVEILGMERINLMHGYSFGDQLIKELAMRIKNHTDRTVYRLDSYRFAICVFIEENVDETVNRMENSIIEIFTSPFTLFEKSIILNFQGGISIGPDEGKTAETLMRNILSTIASDPQSANNRIALFDQERFKQISRRNKIIELLPKGLQKKEFYSLIQPRLSLETGKICGAEILSRWNNHDMGQISPVEFIPLAETTKHIYELTSRVIQEAIELIEKLKKLGNGDLKISINISPALVHGKSLLDLLEKHNASLAGNNLELEFTEGIFLGSYDFMRNIIRAIQAMGIHIGIDDFGTGYSNMEYLQKYEIDVMKIDRRFLVGIPNNERHNAIVKAMLAIAESIGIHAVVEGVENKKQLEWLRKSGCLEIQGYLFSKPIKFAEFFDLLKAHNSLNWKN